MTTITRIRRPHVSRPLPPSPSAGPASWRMGRVPTAALGVVVLYALAALVVLPEGEPSLLTRLVSAAALAHVRLARRCRLPLGEPHGREGR